MFESIFGENWQVIVPLIGAGVALFFPQLKPLIDGLIKPAPGPINPGPVNPPNPTPPAPNPWNPTPTPGPTPQPGPGDLMPIVQALQVLLQWFAANKNKAGEQAVREAGKALFEPEGEPSAK
jgi:hypothetical protein